MRGQVDDLSVGGGLVAADLDGDAELAAVGSRDDGQCVGEGVGVMVVLHKRRRRATWSG